MTEYREIEDFRAETAWELSRSGYEPYTVEWMSEAVWPLLFYLSLVMIFVSLILWGIRMLIP